MTKCLKIFLETRYVGEIEGDFYVPDYQRGYRWTKDEVKLLLDDIYECVGNGLLYCLQPIVLKKHDNKYELIDGQQRLTTIYLIYKYMEKTLGPLLKPSFKLEYETRQDSARFLEDLDLLEKMESPSTKNIDYYFISNAFECIDEYFKNKSSGHSKQMFRCLTELNNYFESKVSVIWYEVNSVEDGVELFERLNIGKIPLTSSELVKALFLKNTVERQMAGRQEEVALQWNMIEHELHNPSFWGFLSNTKGDHIPTRIDLILDLIAGKKERNREDYFTFFYFDQRIKDCSVKALENSLVKVWSEIYEVFLTLREWHANHDFYHKIGFLITAGKSLQEIYNVWKGDRDLPLSKDQFLSELNRMISDVIGLENEDELLRLSYDNDKDKKKLRNVLLLFNIETERLTDGGKRRFPFDKHKESAWSLEHIHAQNAERLQNNEDILTWLESHVTLVKSNFKAKTTLIEKMDRLIGQLKGAKRSLNVRKRFEEIHEEVIPLFTEEAANKYGRPYEHCIANIALLDGAQNAALSNSVFEVKRYKVIEYDKNGRYIPICTKNVFFKYYTEGDFNLSYWGEEDRKGYLKALKDKISQYYQEKAFNCQVTSLGKGEDENYDF